MRGVAEGHVVLMFIFLIEVVVAGFQGGGCRI
jgi:hypothetical protein